MKKLLLFALCLPLILSAKANIVIVNAKIKDLPAGKWIFYREQGGNDAMDSVKSFAGGFKFKIDIADISMIPLIRSNEFSPKRNSFIYNLNGI